MEFLDCRGCSQPLRPPVFQCTMGHPHFLCESCCVDNLPAESKCRTCSGAAFQRCPAMEDAVSTIFLPCKHGCDERITYYRKEEHEKTCPEGPCFCPEPGCGFRGQTPELYNHFTTHHKWPARYFWNCSRFDLDADPGVQILRAGLGGYLILLKVSPMESRSLMVSFVCVQPNPPGLVFDCCFSYKWRSNHSQNVWLDKIPNSSLSDGLPEDCFCILPNVLQGDTSVLKGFCITWMRNDDDAMEEEDDDDSSYDDDEDDEADDVSD